MKVDIQRFLSLDVFRGMTICFMIIVNTPGSGANAFGILQHAGWHGFTPTDLVFPSFLFAVGNAMSFSLNKYRLTSNASFITKVLRRTLLIFILGFLMYWFPFFKIDGEGHLSTFPISETRIMGVLQRIALCYFFGSILIHYLKTNTVIIVSAILLIGYWLLLLLFGNNAQPFSMLGNAGMYLDEFLLGNNHLYHGEGVAFDPEGVLSTLPAIVNVIIGYYAGKLIQTNGKNYETTAKLLLAGAALITIALWWNLLFPINKKIWSSTFVLLTTGIDFILLATLVYVLEIKEGNAGRWTSFFVVFGKNPLFIYLLSEVLAIILYTIPIRPGTSLFSYLNNIIFQPLAPGPIGSLLFALSFMMVCWLAGWWLNKLKIYIRV